MLLKVVAQTDAVIAKQLLFELEQKDSTLTIDSLPMVPGNA